MQDEKSQLQNREKAMRVLRARLYEAALAEQQAELAADRRSQVGTGERAEKIRTYNFQEGRVTDHRVKLTKHNLPAVLEGELDEFTETLQAEERRARLEEQAAGGAAAASVRGVTVARRARRRAGRRSARAARDTPRLDAEVLLAHVLGVDRTALFTDPELHRRGAGGARLPGPRPPPVGRPRAGRLPDRPPGLPPPRARGRPARADPAARDRARWSRPSSSTRRAAPASSTSAPAAAPIALALKDERPDLAVTGSDVSADALEVARANGARLGLDVAWVQADLVPPGAWDVRRLQPALRRRRRRPRSRPTSARTSRTSRSTRAPTGST